MDRRAKAARAASRPPHVCCPQRTLGTALTGMLVSAMHITAGVFVNDDESGLHEDIWKWLEQLAPFRADYAHHRTGEDNGDAHLKSMLVHHEVFRL